MAKLVFICFLLGTLPYHGVLHDAVGSGAFDFPSLSLTPAGHSTSAVSVLEHTGSIPATSTIQKLARKRLPRVILNTQALQWKALSWDLHNMSLTKWTTLHGVLALPTVNTSTACAEPPSVFYVHDEEGSGLIRLSGGGSAAVETSVVAEMSLRTFLDAAAAASIRAPKVKGNKKKYRYLFSADYGALEEELQVL